MSTTSRMWRSAFAVAALISRAHGNGIDFITNFALVAPVGGLDFFLRAHEGCVYRAGRLGKRVACRYAAPETFDPSGQLQAQLIHNLTVEGNVDGISISVVDEAAVQEPIARALDAGIKVVTFDSDAPNSGRAAYIGTDNKAYGERLALVLDQVTPEGGEYVLVTSITPNLRQRTKSFRETLKQIKGTPWTELNDGSSTIFFYGNFTQTLEEMKQLASEYPHPRLGAMVVMLPNLLTSPQWTDIVEENRNMTFIAADIGTEQMTLLQRNKVDALVGQHPYEMGELSASTLYELVHDRKTTSTNIYGTALVEMVRVPVDLPPPNVNQNYIGDLRIMGFVLYGVVVCLDIGFSAWTVARRKDRVVRASQPEFLLLICAGSLIFASSILPMGVDDQNSTQEQADAACMNVYWLLSVGFVLVQSALFAKTWRVNRIFHNPNKFQRVKVTAKDVILPLVGLLAANIIVMICWEVLNPLKYVRHPHSGTDPWNRVISTYGACSASEDRKGGELPYYISLGAINVGALLLANIQAYQARNLSTEYSESKYIAMAMVGMMQIGIVGIPVLVLVYDIPQTMYVLFVLIVFLTTMGVLLLMFVPKIIAHSQWKQKKKEKRTEKVGWPAGRTEALTEAQGGPPCHEAGADDKVQGLKVSVKRKPDERDLGTPHGENADSVGLSVVKLVKEP